MLLEACLSLRYWACVWNVRMRAHSYYGLTCICEEAIRLPGCMRYHERMEARITNKWTSLCMFPALTSSTRKKKDCIRHQDLADRDATESLDATT